jgi:hypothetical protein
MYVHLESLNKKRLNLFWLNFSKDAHFHVRVLYIYNIYIKLIIKYPYIQILDVFNFNVLVFARKFSIMLKGTSHQINYA